MVLEDHSRPGDRVWQCQDYGKNYQPAEIDINAPFCREPTCRGPLRPARL